MFAFIDRAVGSFADDIGFLCSKIGYQLHMRSMLVVWAPTSKIAEGTASFPCVVLICVKNACSRFPVGFSILGDELR